MECELCNSNYNEENYVPKIVKPCAHTYCQNCLNQQKQKEGLFYCPKCPNSRSSASDPSSLPTNSSLLKLIEFRKNEKSAYEKMRKYEIQNPYFFPKIEETIKRKSKPFELTLSEIRKDELIYMEKVENPYLDKRTLGAYKKYVFNTDSILMNYFFLSQRTRFLFLFRRLNGCSHKHSCFESIARKLYNCFAYYGLIRIPLYFLWKHFQGADNNVMDKGSFIIAEVLALLLLGGLNSAGCFIRYMNEDSIVSN